MSGRSVAPILAPERPVRRAGFRPALAVTLGLASSPPLHAIELGDPLRQALQELQVRYGLMTIYSEQLIPAELRVRRKLDNADAESVRIALLAEHGLRCRMLHARCVVERIPPQPPPPAEEPPAPPVTLRPVAALPSHYDLLGQAATYLDRQQIEATPHAADDVLRAVRNVPAVAGSDLRAPIHVRGGQHDEVALRLDGLELYRPYHLPNLLNALGMVDSNLIGNIDFYAGVWPSRFGGRMSAVLDISSRRIEGERWREAGISAMNTYFSYGRQYDAGDLLVSARRGYVDLALKLTGSSDEVKPGYYDVFLRRGWDLDDIHHVDLNLFVADDDILYRENGGGQRSHGLSAAGYLWSRWRSDWTANWSSETLLAHIGLDQRRNGFDHDEQQTVVVDEDRRDLRGWRLQHEHWWQLGEGRSVQAGFQWRSEHTDYDYVATLRRHPRRGTASSEHADVQRSVAGGDRAVWLEGTQQFGERWQFNVGVRDTHYHIDGAAEQRLDPHLALSWAATPERRLRLGFGRVSQGQRSDELTLADGETRFYPAQQAQQSVLSWEQWTAAGLRWRIEVFDKRWRALRPRYENLFNPHAIFPETEADRVLVNADRAFSRGAELELRGQAAHSHWWLRYSQTHSRERVEGSWQRRSWDQPQALQLGMSRSWVGGWYLSSQLDVHRGWPITPLQAALDAAGQPILVLGARNAARLPMHVNLALRWGRSIELAHSQLTWYVDVFNLLDWENPVGINRYSAYRGPDGQAQVAKRYVRDLPRLPSLGLRWTF